MKRRDLERSAEAICYAPTWTYSIDEEGEGTCALKEVANCSITTAYFMPFILLQSGLLEHGGKRSSRRLHTWLSGHHYDI